MSEQKTMDDVIREIREDLAKWEQWASPETVVKDVPMNEVSDVYYRQCEAEKKKRERETPEDTIIRHLSEQLERADYLVRMNCTCPEKDCMADGCVYVRDYPTPFKAGKVIIV